MIFRSPKIPRRDRTQFLGSGASLPGTWSWRWARQSQGGNWSWSPSWGWRWGWGRRGRWWWPPKLSWQPSGGGPGGPTDRGSPASSCALGWSPWVLQEPPGFLKDPAGISPQAGLQAKRKLPESTWPPRKVRTPRVLSHLPTRSWAPLCQLPGDLVITCQILTQMSLLKPHIWFLT